MGTFPKPVNRRHRGKCALVLLGVLGISAFVFSAISPLDDDYQHECILGGRTLRTGIRNAKATTLKVGHNFQAFALTSNGIFLELPTAGLWRIVDVVGRAKPLL